MYIDRDGNLGVWLFEATIFDNQWFYLPPISFPTFPVPSTGITIPLMPISGDFSITPRIDEATQASDTPSSDTTAKQPKVKKRSKYRIGKRYRYPSKKGAYEAAKRAGKGAEPTHHTGKYPHYHPNVKIENTELPKQATIHDHYFYPDSFNILFVRNTDDYANEHFASY